MSAYWILTFHLQKQGPADGPQEAKMALVIKLQLFNKFDLLFSTELPPVLCQATFSFPK
jgi:hypothetical protein